MARESELDVALIDVRKAYRLLWCYQRQIFDIIRMFVEEFDDLSFYYWKVAHASRPCNPTSNPLERWTWDMLPMMWSSYLFLPTGIDTSTTKRGQWMLEIRVESDSGFDHTRNNAEPDPKDFEAADESESLIRVYAWYCTGDTKLNWYWGVWNQIDYPEDDGEPVESADPPFRVVRETIKIGSLTDKAAVERAASEFKEMVSQVLGITLA